MTDSLFTVRFRNREKPSLFFDLTDLISTSEREALKYARAYAAQFLSNQGWEVFIPTIPNNTKTITDLEAIHGTQD